MSKARFFQGIAAAGFVLFALIVAPFLWLASKALPHAMPAVRGLLGSRHRPVRLFAYRLGSFVAFCRQRLGMWMQDLAGRLGVICYAFPGSVTADIAFGIVGEWAFDGPCRAQPARISHGTAADIVVGRWFTLAADGTARPGGAAPAGGHAGVLMNPKNYSSSGAGGVALAPNMTLPTGTIGEFGYMGSIIVSVANAAAIGQAAKYADATGIISAGAPGAGETAIPNSKFIRYANAAAGLAVLEVTI